MSQTTMRPVTPRLMSWASIIEPKTQAQAELTSTMPFVHRWVALMPDCHLGKGATVGSVIRPWAPSSPLPSASTSAAG